MLYLRDMPLILLMVQGIEVTLKNLKFLIDGISRKQTHSLAVLWKHLQCAERGCELQAAKRIRYKDLCQEHSVAFDDNDVVLEAYHNPSAASHIFWTVVTLLPLTR